MQLYINMYLNKCLNTYSVLHYLHLDTSEQICGALFPAARYMWAHIRCFITCRSEYVSTYTVLYFLQLGTCEHRYGALFSAAQYMWAQIRCSIFCSSVHVSTDTVLHSLQLAILGQNRKRLTQLAADRCPIACLISCRAAYHQRWWTRAARGLCGVVGRWWGMVGVWCGGMVVWWEAGVVWWDCVWCGAL